MWAPDREYMSFWGDRKMRARKGFQSADFPLDGCRVLGAAGLC